MHPKYLTETRSDQPFCYIFSYHNTLLHTKNSLKTVSATNPVKLWKLQHLSHDALPQINTYAVVEKEMGVQNACIVATVVVSHTSNSEKVKPVSLSYA